MMKGFLAVATDIVKRLCKEKSYASVFMIDVA